MMADIPTIDIPPHFKVCRRVHKGFRPDEPASVFPVSMNHRAFLSQSPSGFSNLDDLVKS
jgi:hypothetical protein